MKCYKGVELYWQVIEQLRRIRLPISLGQDPDVVPKINGMSMFASVDVRDFRISISIPHLIHLWSASQQYYFYYSALGKLAKRGVTESLTNYELFVVQPELKNAISTYEVTRSDIPYGKESDLNEEREVCCEDKHCEKVTAICAASLLWIMLHETAHLALDHPLSNLIPENTRAEEEAADAIATELFEMLGSINKETQFHFRFGLLVTLIELFPPTPKKAGPAYPEFPDRLATWLFQLEPDENHELFGLAALLLRDIAVEWGVHLDDTENESVQSPKDLFKVALKYYRVLMNRI